MDYKKTLKNNHGATLIYILAAFMIISFIGVTMIKQSHHEQKASSDFSAMTTAEHAARSGIQATIDYFENDPNSTNILSLLNAYIHDASHSPRWILGDNSTYISVNSNLKYKTQLLNFSYDNVTFSNNFRVTINSYGLGKGNSQKIITTVLNLNGLGWKNDPNQVPTNALYLGSGAGEIVSPINVHGDTYVNNPASQFVDGPHTSDFFGTFRTGTGTTTMQFRGCTFHKQAYFRCPVNFNAADALFLKGAGFEKMVTNDGVKFEVVDGDVYFNDGFSGNGNNHTTAPILNDTNDLFWNTGSSNTYETSDDDDMADIVSDEGPGSTSYSSSISNIAGQLGISAEAPPELNVDLSAANSYRIPVSSISSQPDGDDFNDEYEDKVGNLFGHPDTGFLVVSGMPSNYNAVSSDGPFKYKLIWILENNGVKPFRGLHLFNTTSNAIVLIYLKNTRFEYVQPGSYFRGMFFAEDWTGTGKHIFRGNSGHVYGAMYFEDAIFRLESGGGDLDIHWDSTAINQLAMLNIFKTEGSVPSDTLQLTGSSILTNNLGTQF